MGALVLIVRPLVHLAHDLVTQQAVAPGFTNLIRWQTHRWVLRQSMSYFANDFAGRIASNIVQSAASLRESVVQIVDALWFVATFAITAIVIFARADIRLAMPLVVWIAYYLGVLCVMVPRIRRRSEALAHERANLTGRVVDAYTNIQTVKAVRAYRSRGRRRARRALHASRRVPQTDAAHHLLNLLVSSGNSVMIVVDGGLVGLAVERRRADASATSRWRSGSPCASSPCPAG